MTRAALLVAVCAAAAVLAACGNPRTPRKTFTFTPVPYTVVPGPFPCPPRSCTTVIAFDKNGGGYAADQVSVRVNSADVDELTDWLDSYGFTVIDKLAEDPTTFLTVRVPPGSVSDAVELIKGNKLVVHAEPNGFLRGN